MERLDFEKPIVELEEQLNKAIQLGIDTDADVKKTVNDLENQLKKQLIMNTMIGKIQRRKVLL